ncbi:hypothetical protein DLAC_07807 [Tieghemostelium lacteum]|uniref:F-box domain-containing protein n=1 Tax=Tieghemostelium lacteum TaxID=361077 RepID=A0A151ZAF5_TIELA|nr:hypothetical protein DLAC_07807 [Tieghemostelium lacteum]|eukprot:KYQ90931.1 hypothetical protein DLAC_07807 [Tieghemostelium lacteum]
MNCQILPNYVFIKILNYLARRANQRKIYFKLIEKVSLVSKEWRYKILPKLRFTHLTCYLPHGMKILEIQSLVDRGVFILPIRISLSAEITSESLSLKTLQLPNDFIASTVVATISFENLTDKTSQQVHNEILGKFKKITTMDIVNFNSTFHHLTPNFFDGIRKLELSSCNILIETIVDIVERTKGESLLLRSTPTYNIGIKNEYLMDSIYKYCEGNQTLKSLSVYNFHWKGSNSAAISLIHNNSTLTELNLTNLCGDMPSDVKINNRMIKRFYYESSRIKDFLRLWDSPSALEYTSLGTLLPDDIPLIRNNFKSLSSVVISGSTSIELIIDLILLNNPIEKFHIDVGTKLYANELVKALQFNNNLTELYISNILPLDALSQFLNSQHPTIRSLRTTLVSSTLIQVKGLLLDHKILEKLAFVFSVTRDTKPTEIINTITEIIKHNHKLISFDCQYFDTQLQGSQLNQIIQLIDLINLNPNLLRFSIFQNNNIPKVLQTFLTNKLIDF